MTREVVKFGPTEEQMAAMDRCCKNPLSRELTCTGDYISVKVRTAIAEIASFLMRHDFRLTSVVKIDGFEYLERDYVPRDRWSELADVLDAACVIGEIRR